MGSIYKQTAQHPSSFLCNPVLRKHDMETQIIMLSHSFTNINYSLDLGVMRKEREPRGIGIQTSCVESEGSEDLSSFFLLLSQSH